MFLPNHFNNLFVVLEGFPKRGFCKRKTQETNPSVHCESLHWSLPNSGASLIGDDFWKVVGFDVLFACCARVIVRPTIEAEGGPACNSWSRQCWGRVSERFRCFKTRMMILERLNKEWMTLGSSAWCESISMNQRRLEGSWPTPHIGEAVAFQKWKRCSLGRCFNGQKTLPFRFWDPLKLMLPL